MARKRKRKKIVGFMSVYKTYDYEQEGFGSPWDWKKAFNFRMGFEEAEKFFQDKEYTPEQILGLPEDYTFDMAKSQFRKLILECHPDRGGSTEEAQKIIAAYEIIKHKWGET
jgi:DnaJ-class molecular chaperone